MPYCVVFGCRQKEEKGIHFHMFPRNETLKKIWEHRCCREKGWTSKYRTVICSRHFEQNQYERYPNTLERLGYQNPRAKLKWDAVPTLFSNTNWKKGRVDGVFVDKARHEGATSTMIHETAHVGLCMTIRNVVMDRTEVGLIMLSSYTIARGNM